MGPAMTKLQDGIFYFLEVSDRRGGIVGIGFADCGYHGLSGTMK